MSRGYVKFNDDGTIETAGTAAYAAVEDFAPAGVYEKVLGTANVADATATGSVNLYTCPASRIAIPSRLIVLATDLTGFVSTAIFTVGVTGGDIISATTLTDLTTAGSFTQVQTTTARYMLATEVAVFNLLTAYVATTASLAVVLMGIEAPA